MLLTRDFWMYMDTSRIELVDWHLNNSCRLVIILNKVLSITRRRYILKRLAFDSELSLTLSSIPLLTRHNSTYVHIVPHREYVYIRALFVLRSDAIGSMPAIMSLSSDVMMRRLEGDYNWSMHMDAYSIVGPGASLGPEVHFNNRGNQNSDHSQLTHN